MGHYVVVTEGYTDSHDRWAKDLHGVTIPADNPGEEPGRIRVREARTYTYSFNDRCKKNALARLNSSFGNSFFSFKGKEWRLSTWRQRLLIICIRIFIKAIGVKHVDNRGLPYDSWADDNRKRGRHYLLRGYVIGEKSDQKIDGVEQV